MHSTAQASGRAWDSSPPQAAAAARHNAGRMRFPPANSGGRWGRWIVAGLAVAAGRKPSKARLTVAARVARKSGRENGLRERELGLLTVMDMGGCCRES